MLEFCRCGADLYCCQKCGKSLCIVDFPPVWRVGIGNSGKMEAICPSCSTARRTGRMLRPVIEDDLRILKEPVKLLEEDKEPRVYSREYTIRDYGVRIVTTIPNGFHIINGEIVVDTKKAIFFRNRTGSASKWFPKSQLVVIYGERAFYAPRWLLSKNGFCWGTDIGPCTSF